MAVAVRAKVFAGLTRIIMPTGGQPWYNFAVFFPGFAAGVFVKVKSVDAGRQPFQVRGEQYAVRCFFNAAFP